MGMYIALDPLIEAYPWYRNGDHPEDRNNRIIGYSTAKRKHFETLYEPHVET